MALQLQLQVLLLLLHLFLRAPQFAATSASLVGVNYGLVADNLPPPEKVVPLLSSIGVGRVKIYNSDPKVLTAFADTGIELVIGLPNECVLQTARDPSAALSWVKSNVQAYASHTKISSVTVGNEVLTSNDTSLPRALLPAMTAIRSALDSLNFKDVSVTTAHSVAILASSYPPSAATFRRELIPILCPLLDFHIKTGTPFLVNAYPYFAYKSEPHRVSVEYATFEPNPGVLDNATGLHYTNMLHAQVDAVYAAIVAAGGAEATGLEVRVSETGWPSAGDEDEAGATAENAANYNGNLMKMVAKEEGTPARPKNPLRVYVFALFNENKKPGPASERNYGLFKPDGTPAYELGIVVPQENTTAAAAGGGGGDVLAGQPSGLTTDGYYSYSAARRTVVGRGVEATVVMTSLVGLWLMDGMDRWRVRM